MKIYICSPYDGIEENYFRAINYCSYVIEKGHIPLCPVTMLHGVLNDKIPKEYDCFKKIQKELCLLCDEIWVFGKAPNSEVQLISGFGKEVRYIQDTFRFNNTSETLSVLCRQYETMTGRTINRGILESMIYYLNQGQTDKLIIAAIKKSAKNNAGWSYTEGILKNCLSKGITTAEQFKNETPKTPPSDYATYDIDLYERMLNGKE